MYWILFLLAVFLNGYILNSFFLPKNKGILEFVNAFILGSFFSVNYIYFLNILLLNLSLATIVYLLTSLFLIFIFKKNLLKNFLSIFTSLNKREGIFFSIIFIGASYLFFKTFNYDSKTGEFLIASNIYLDFGSHVPFIRSFSLGNNFPAEVPFFANNGLIYHFMFDLYAGILEYLGLRIDIAFNLVSILAFAGLFIYIYKLSQKIFDSGVLIPIVTVMLCLFNSSLSFLLFFKKNGFSPSAISSFWHNTFYLDDLYKPFTGDFAVAGFWSLNTLFNQRHLIFGLLVAFLCIYILLNIIDLGNKPKIRTLVFLGAIIGLMPFWHSMMFMAIIFVLAGFIILSKSLRKQFLILLLIALIFALPEFFAIKLHSENTIIFKPGFLANENFSIINFIKFWFYNLGFSILTLPIGFFLANNKQRKIFLVFMLLFIIPNLFQFSNRFVFDDHKFFNLWILLMNGFSAFALIAIYKKNIFGKTFSVSVFILLTLSGIISIMVAKNDVYARIIDYPKNSFLSWSIKNIPKNAIVATSGEIYDPMSIIGKKTIMGRAHYVFVYGGNPSQRLMEQDEILAGNIAKTKEVIKRDNINYIVLYKNGFAKNNKEYDLKLIEKEFKKIYDDKYGTIFKI
ncbi:MAG: hypothetical protein ABH816_02350 [Candidatus Levyibacteriota bacterium]